MEKDSADTCSSLSPICRAQIYNDPWLCILDKPLIDFQLECHCLGGMEK